jgi:hypothetical protein
MGVSLHSLWTLAPILAVVIIAVFFGAILARGDDLQARRRAGR